MAQRVWDTRTLPESEQWTYWRDVVWDAFVPVTLTRHDDGGFPSSVHASTVGGMGVSRLRSAPQSVRRTAEDIVRHAGGMYFLNMPLQGNSTAAQDGRMAELRPGDFAIVDSEVPFELNFAETFHQVSLTIPREMLAPLLAEPGSATGVRVPGDSGVGAVASAAIRAVAEQGSSLDRRAATGAAAHVAGLVALAVRGLAPEPRASASRRVLLRAANDEILARFADPDLTPASVAGCLAISVRQLHRLFAEDGTTFGRVLLDHRLDVVRRRLEDPVFAPHTITQLAMHNGFADPSHFGRAFKSVYGCTPAQYRRDHLRSPCYPATVRAGHSTTR